MEHKKNHNHGKKLGVGALCYITIPPSVLEHFAHRGEFSLDPAIPLPVELPAEGELKTDALTGEMFLSGMLLDLAENPQGPHSGYYRKLTIALRPKLLPELTEAAALKARNGDHETALEILALLEGLYPRHPAVLLNRALVLEEKAFALENRGRQEEAEEAFAETENAYESALSFPLPDSFLNAGLFYRNRGEYRRASDCLGSYLDAGEENPGEEREDKEAKARSVLEEIRNNGLDDEAFLEAIKLIRGGNEEGGILKAREFLERRPGAGRGWFVLGWGLRRLERWEDGEACFEKAVELGCGNADTRNELAICRMERGELGEAERELEKALRLDPDNVKIISNMGILALKKGDKERAAAFFRTVLELEPEDPIARAFLG